MKFGRNSIGLLALLVVVCVAVYFLYGRDRDVAEKLDTGEPDQTVSEEATVSEVAVSENSLFIPCLLYTSPSPRARG